MESPRTNLFLTNSVGETVINDFSDNSCLNCILQAASQGMRSAVCKFDNKKRHVFLMSDADGKLYICDNKEKTVKNFQTLVELIKHCRPSLLRRYDSQKDAIQREVRKEMEAFKHNIVHINSDAINEFYYFIDQDYLFKNYRQMQDKIAETVKSDPEEAVELIARLAKYNLNIKTELSVVSKLNNPDSKPNFSLGNPRDAVMSSVYTLYPMFRQRKVYVTVGEFHEKIEIDYDALQVASFYIIENATKYTKKDSTVNITFTRDKHNLTIGFAMCSLFISEVESNCIFDEGFQGEQAKKSSREGKGIGLYRAKRLVHFFEGEIRVDAGKTVVNANDGCKYAENVFQIDLPVRMPIR